jgi:CheY-like chemotaxis protein
MNGKKILVVDDDPVFTKAISFRLKAEGFEVITALDGGEAVSAMRRHKPDLLVVDIFFPPDVAHGGGGCLGWISHCELAAADRRFR